MAIPIRPGSRTAPFANASDLLLTPDHYLFRMLYSQGVPLDALGVRNRQADPREAWRLLAQHYHLFLGTPSRMWLDWVFAHVFGMDVALRQETSDLYFDTITAMLATDALQPRSLFDGHGIELIATTESPLDTLEHHAAIRAENARAGGWQARVITAYRSDPVVDPDFEGFATNLGLFSNLTGEDCFTWSGYLAAHWQRRAFFADMGATSSGRRSDAGVAGTAGEGGCRRVRQRAVRRGRLFAASWTVNDAAMDRLVEALA